MNKSTLAILTAALGVAAGILIEKRTSWFDHLMRGEQIQKKAVSLLKS